MNLQIHNTLTGRKETFVPSRPGEVRMYVCGVTPYDVCHVGHARCYVVFDVIRRVFKAAGYRVRLVQNFTDVDDKIIARAAESRIGPLELVRRNIDDFYTKMDALGIERADVYPRVTEHIPEIIDLIRKIEDRGAGYRLGDDVYYAVDQFPGYGKLSKKPVAELQAGARVEVNLKKRSPLDFALWKGAKPGEPEEVTWDSPWGRGRPGWHIECSAMSLKHLGPDFDIHGGGLDLIFPHHENEIAQSEAGTGQPFARVWMHNGFVTVNQEKMSKSLGNFFTLSQVFEKYHPSVVRYMLLTVHYRSPLDYSTELLDQSRQALSNLKAGIVRATTLMRHQSGAMDAEGPADPEVTGAANQRAAEFMESLADDFNTPGALGALHQLSSLLERQFADNVTTLANVRSILANMRTCTEILGVDIFPRPQDILVPSEVTEWAKAREDARKRKDWAEADRLRNKILERGYVVEDTPSGPRILPKAS